MVTAEASELFALLSPSATTLLQPKLNYELENFTTDEAQSKNLVEVAQSILDIFLAIPRKIVAVIRRIITAVYAYWVLVFRTIYQFIASVIATIANSGGGIINFYRELFAIFVGIFV